MTRVFEADLKARGAPMKQTVHTQYRRLLLSSGLLAPALGACALRPSPLSDAGATEQVRAAENAFAATMARRDLAGFAALIAKDAVFINGGQPLRGRGAIVEYWSRHFKAEQAPFTWRPEIVEVAAAGTLGYTEGPVTAGAQVIAKFYSTWQLQADGNWLVVFDNGYAQCRQ
jgi:ketosteroid isomerase-like protein